MTTAAQLNNWIGMPAEPEMSDAAQAVRALIAGMTLHTDIVATVDALASRLSFFDLAGRAGYDEANVLVDELGNALERCDRGAAEDAAELQDDMRRDMARRSA